MKAIYEAAKKVKLLVFDVDGVLTDGQLYLNDQGIEIKAFHSQDGIGIKMLQRSGIDCAIITGRKSDLVTKRMESLQIHHVYQGIADKFTTYTALKKKLGLDEAQIAMMGDDLPDLKIMKHCGLGIAVANAQTIIKEHGDYTTQAAGGWGAAREACELIMTAQGTLLTMQQPYF